MRGEQAVTNRRHRGAMENFTTQATEEKRQHEDADYRTNKTLHGAITAMQYFPKLDEEKAH